MKRNILAIVLLCITLFAAFLGLFAQGIAYYFANNLLNESPFKMLIIVTTISIVLFIVVFVAEMILLVMQKWKPKIFVLMLIANVGVGFFVSVWSLFVLAMWAG